MQPSQDNIFVNRHQSIESVVEAINKLSVEGSTVRVFYGPGGQGKTALCRHLFRREYKEAETGKLKLHRAFLDLHARHSALEPEKALVIIRNEFAKSGVSMPAFDQALALMWETTRGEEPFPVLTNPWLGKTSEAFGAVAPEAVVKVGETMADIVAMVPGIGAGLSWAGRWSIDKTKLALLKRSHHHLARLFRDGEPKYGEELKELLPWMLAQDLAYHLDKNPRDRFLLLIDEYEGLFDQGGAGNRRQETPLDDLLRSLIKCSKGMLACFFSREPFDKIWQHDRDMTQALIGSQTKLEGLSDDFADEWLQEIPIQRADIRQAIIDGSKEDKDPDALVYPLLLELQADHWAWLVDNHRPIQTDDFALNEEKFKERCHSLINRLLRNYGEETQNTIKRLALANRFDKAAFDHLIKTFPDEKLLQSSAFERLTRLSFISSDEDGFFSLHRAIAEALAADLNKEEKSQSLNALFDHFDQRAIAENHWLVDSDKATALIEAVALARQLSKEDYIPWLYQRSEPFRVAARFGFVENLWQQALFFASKPTAKTTPLPPPHTTMLPIT